MIDALKSANKVQTCPTPFHDIGKSSKAESPAIEPNPRTPHHLTTPSKWAHNPKVAKVLQWMFFEQYSHEPNVAVVRYWVSIAVARPRESVIEARRKAGYEALDAMERELATREFLVADRYTIADIALYAYTHVAGEGGFDLSGYPAIGRWLNRVASQPGHVSITA
jgi:glutathione S-transferase